MRWSRHAFSIAIMSLLRGMPAECGLGVEGGLRAARSKRCKNAGLTYMRRWRTKQGLGDPRRWVLQSTEVVS